MAAGFQMGIITNNNPNIGAPVDNLSAQPNTFIIKTNMKIRQSTAANYKIVSFPVVEGVF